MNLHDLPQRVDRLAGLDGLLQAFDVPQRLAQVEGLTGPAKSLFLARVYQRRSGHLLIVTFQEEQAQRLLDDLRQFGVPADLLFHFPALESRWLNDDVTDLLDVGVRIVTCTARAYEPH